MPMPQDDVDELQSEEVESDVAGINRDLFKDQHGLPIGFFLHKSIKKGFSRRNLSQDIKRHGGIVLDTDVNCNTVLVDVMYDKKETLQISYNIDNDPCLRKVFVEWASFVQRCIRNNRFIHRLPALKGMGGTVGRVRVPFTAHDDESLCYYIARVLPDKAAGGRLGLDVYKVLVKTAAVKDTLAWGARHTAESWKEHYKKNAVEFDKWIEDIVKQEGQSRKQLWPQDRRASQKYLRGRHKYEPEEPEEDWSEGSNEEEPPEPQRQRQRTGYSPSPPIRRRVVQRSSDQQIRTHRSGGKGKARAVEEEEEEDTDELDQSRDQVGQDQISEPGPSGSRRSLEATNVAVDVLTHRTQPSTASFFTQETVVATAPSVQSKEASHLSDEAESSSLGRSIQSTKGAKQASPSGHEPLAVIDLTSPSGSIGLNFPVIRPSPARTLVNPSQTQEAWPSTYKRPSRAARRPRVMIEAAAADAPYRNTRSRSQSVELNTSNSPVRKTKKRRNNEAQKRMPALATVDEIQDDDRQNNENLEMVVPPPLGEILADEIDVEKMLFSDQDEELGEVDEVRGVSLDTDDGQTELNLRPTQPPRQAFSSLQRHPSNVLKEFQESSAIWSQPSAPLATRLQSFNRSAVPVRNTPVRNTQEIPGNILPPSPSRNILDAYRIAEPPRTPFTRPRKNSASSTDPFPVSGSRASAFKKKLQQQEKRNPYNPPAGTRAAKLARSRR